MLSVKPSRAPCLRPATRDPSVHDNGKGETFELLHRRPSLAGSHPPSQLHRLAIGGGATSTAKTSTYKNI
eukprot:scaffold308764_cov39-Tisochrysis_lutea.AAC.1